MPKIIKGKNEEYSLKEDWKINAWDRKGRPLIRNGKPTKLLNKRKKIDFTSNNR